NMQLCFGIPLFLLFFVRFCRRPGLGPALGMALAFWAQAVSALYYATILLLVLPFLAAPYLRRLAVHISSRRVWYAVLAGGSLCVALCALYLHPYWRLQHETGLERHDREMRKHSLEPLSYLERYKHDTTGTSQEWIHVGEMVAWPGVAVGALAVGYLFTARRIAERRPRAQPHRRRVAEWLGTWHMACWLGILALCLIAGYWPLGVAGKSPPMLTYCANALLAGVALSGWVLAFAFGKAGGSRALIGGLAAAAAAAFVFSLGPVVSFGPAARTCPNYLFKTWLVVAPVLRSMRVVSRFSVIVLTLVATVAATTLDLAARRWRPRLRWAWIPLLAVVWFESHVRQYRFATPETPSPTVRRALSAHPGKPLVVLPMGDRRLDANYMLGCADSKVLLVNGWSGFEPLWTQHMNEAFAAGDMARALDGLSRLWPAPLVLVDRKALAVLVANHYGTTESNLAARCDFVADDAQYALYRPRRPAEASLGDDNSDDVYSVVIRGDLAARRGGVSFAARGNGRTTNRVAVCCNGGMLATVTPDAQWRTYTVAMPAVFLKGLRQNRLHWRSLDQCPWQIREVDFVRPALTTTDPCSQTLRDAGYYDAERGFSDPGIHLDGPGERVEVRFGRDIFLEGYTCHTARVSPGGDLRMRYYWTCSRSADTTDLRVFMHARSASGTPLFQDDHVFLAKQNTHFQPYRRVFLEERATPVPTGVRADRVHVWIGICHASSGRRLVPHTTRPIQARAVSLPVVVEVTSPELLSGGQDHAISCREHR
ncbi:MAG: hypothetical protein PHR35_18950, partial [Kiritimatiellae bacterium]|nr:hypothetical protein [Kiritimatiellia bacterium]